MSDLGELFFLFRLSFYLFIYSLAPTNTLILVSMRKSIPRTKKFAAGTDAVMDLPHRAMGSRQKQIGTGFLFFFSYTSRSPETQPVVVKHG